MSYIDRRNKIIEPEGFLDNDSIECMMDEVRIQGGYNDRLEYDDLLNIIYTFYLHILAQNQIMKDSIKCFKNHNINLK